MNQKLLTPLILMSFIISSKSALSQVVGSRDNSGLTPTNVEASQLSGGGYSGDVNVFNGTYSSSYPLGTVSTPGGLSYSLKLNYSSSYSAGESPSVCSGIPYGEGWHVNIPMITVSNAAYFPFLESYECYTKYSQLTPDTTSYFTKNDTVNGFTRSSGSVQGDIFWFSPQVSLPNVGSGRAVFKYIDENDANCAVFVMNKFERHVELRFRGDRWEVTDDSGNRYFFNTTLVTHRSPNNQRVLNYAYNNKDNNNQVHGIITDSDYGKYDDDVLNVIEPKQTYTSWYCNVITNRNIPGQSIQFYYEKFGAFNYFKEFEQPLLEDEINDKLRGTTVSADYTAYTDIYLKKVVSNVQTTPFEILELEYGLLESNQIPTPLLDPRDTGTERLDSLYSYKSVYHQGSTENFEDWQRYFHAKSDSAVTLSGSTPTIVGDNPYLTTNNGATVTGYIRNSAEENTQLPFAHSFLESPRILTDNTTLIPGDIYEIKTEIADNNGSSDHQMGNGLVDINIATGYMNVHLPTSTCQDVHIECDTLDQVEPYDSLVNCCDTLQWEDFTYGTYSNLNSNSATYVYAENNYTSTRGGAVFTTHNQAIKWNLASADNSINTSNFFMMPNVPSYNDGMNIQIGPANSDHNYSKYPDNIERGSGTDIPSAYKTYAHIDNAYHLAPYANIAPNFGVGLPWSMTEPLYVELMGSPYITNPNYSDMYEFWWNEPNSNVNWSNEPTKFDENVYLKEVELIRYSKSPYMLQSAKLYRVNGEINSLDDTSGVVLISNQEMEYGVNSHAIIENLNYRVGQSDTLRMSTNKQFVYTLEKVKNIPVAGWEDDPTVVNSYSDDEILQTEFEYEWYGLDTANINYDIYGNPGRHGRILNKIINQLGGITAIEYYPYLSDATLKESSYIPRSGCASTGGVEKRPIPRSGAKDVHPAVRYITVLDENDNLTDTTATNPLKRWEYVYDTTQIIFQTTDFNLPSKFRSGWKRSYSKGFAKTIKYEPELITGEKPYTIYSHLGNVYKPVFDTTNQIIINDIPTIEEYLFFGKVDSIQVFNANGELEEETIIDYDYTKAYINGYVRNNFERNNLIAPNDYTDYGINFVHSREYEYSDFYKNESPSYTGTTGQYIVFDDGDSGTSIDTTLSDNTTIYEGDTLLYINNTGGVTPYISNYFEVRTAHQKSLGETGTISGSTAKPVILSGGFLFNNWGNAFEKAAFLETFFYNDLIADTTNPSFYFHSYFVKTTSQINRTYDDGLSKDAFSSNTGIGDDPDVPENPFGNPFINTVAHEGDQETYYSQIEGMSNGAEIYEDLVSGSPLSDVNLLLLLGKAKDWDPEYLEPVLNAQGDMSDDVLYEMLFQSPNISSTSLVTNVLGRQSYISDSLQLDVAADYLQNIGGEDTLKITTAILQKVFDHNPYLSNSVIFGVLASPAFPHTYMRNLLVEQDQMSEELLLDMIEPSGSKIPDFVIVDVFLHQEILSDSIFEVMLTCDSLSANSIVKIYSQSENYPSDETLLDFLDMTSTFTQDQMTTVALAATRELGTSVMEELSLILTAARYAKVEAAQSVANPYGAYCNNQLEYDRLYIETKTEYEYYEAQHNGKTLCQAYKKLLGLEDIEGKKVVHNDLNDGDTITLDSIWLKHEPSWQLFSARTTSPHYPNAFKEDQYFYYYDLLNRRSRHYRYYDLENGGFVFDVDTTYYYGDTAVICTFWPDDHQLTGAYQGYFPLTDGARMSQRNSVRNIAFQRTTFSRNNSDTDSLIQSEYYFYDSRWNTNEINIDSSVTYSGPSCPSDPPDCEPEYECTDCYPVKYTGSQQDLLDALPFGYCLVLADGNYFMCPHDVDLLDYGATSVDLKGCFPDQFDPEDTTGTTKALPQGDALERTFYLKQVVVQLDTLSSESALWTNQRMDQSNSYIMDFVLGDENDKDSLLRRISFAAYPFDTLAVRNIDKRNEYTQVSLERNATGIYTKYYYNKPIRIWHVNSNNSSCSGYGNYSSTVNTDIGMPQRITVGFGRNDSLSTTYSYHPNYALDSTISPNGYELKYEYDDYDRLKKTWENDRLLSDNTYEYWNRSDTSSYLTRTNQNYVETYLYNGPIVSGNYEGEHIRAFIDPLGRNYSTTTNIDGDSTQIHSGTVTYDNWGRVTKAYKPYKLSSQTSLNRSANTSLAFTQSLYENTPKSRMLRNAKYGIASVNDVHTVKQEYHIINKVVLSCELDLSSYETGLLVNSNYSGNPRYVRVRTEDEDEKVKFEYFNAFGQKVGTKQFGEHGGDEIITLYTYDSYGNLTKVINPEKQESDYEYNILGQLFRETTVDAGEHKFMYNKLGLVSVEHDANGRAGELSVDTDSVLAYYRTYEYDDYGRLLKQQRHYWQDPYENSPIKNDRGIDVLFYIDTVSGTTITSSGQQDFFRYYFSNNSTYDWMAELTYVSHPGGIGSPDSITGMATDFLGTITTEEKKFTYGQTTSGNGLGKVTISESFNMDGQVVHKTTYTYNNEERLATEVIEFNPTAFSDTNQTIKAKITYQTYNYRGSLLTMNVDVHNDGYLDFQYHYNYDDWNRLTDVYANFWDTTYHGNRVAHYEYNDALGLLTETKHYVNQDTCSEQTEWLAQTITYTYDVRDRLTQISSTLSDYDLYYDDNDVPADVYSNTVNNTHSWNGNINGIRATYNFSASTIVNPAGPAGYFDDPTYYGYRYDSLNRLTEADAIVGDQIDTGNSLTYDIGDVTFAFDKIGNFTNLRRVISTSTTDEWDYQYASGKNHLTKAQGVGSTSDRDYTYDQNGNLFSDNERDLDTITYTRASYPYHITGNSHEIDYLYSVGDLRMYKKEETTADTVEEYYLKNLGIVDMTTGNWTWYINGADRVAKVTPRTYQQPDAISSNSGVVDTNHLDISFYLYDHLGNTRVVYTPEVRACGSVDITLEYAGDYYPYGKILREYANGPTERYLTTQHERDEETGLDYRGARFYDSDVARFLSLDPLAAEYPGWSNYNYVLGNPVILVDSDGKKVKPMSKEALQIILLSVSPAESEYIKLDKNGYIDKRAMRKGKRKLGGVGNNYLALFAVVKDREITEVYVNQETHSYIESGNPVTDKFDTPVYESTLDGAWRHDRVSWEAQGKTIEDYKKKYTFLSDKKEWTGYFGVTLHNAGNVQTITGNNQVYINPHSASWQQVEYMGHELLGHQFFYSIGKDSKHGAWNPNDPKYNTELENRIKNAMQEAIFNYTLHQIKKASIQ
ncbi:MAG: RHS repeat-associated core domain-containing protein [Crocinitomicaceae bacterium]|nr:RHS repeat-associated core domain-containing protein [Crocinitomicaceae bacterium]